MRLQGERLQAVVDEWNAANAVGANVIVTKDMGEEVHTKTRSAAWVLSGHTAVVMVEGISGGYLLSRVRAK